jgi:hypothetical protein
MRKTAEKTASTTWIPQISRWVAILFGAGIGAFSAPAVEISAPSVYKYL